MAAVLGKTGTKADIFRKFIQKPTSQVKADLPKDLKVLVYTWGKGSMDFQTELTLEGPVLHNSIKLTQD